MDFATPLLHRALAQARADWLAGDPAAWSRYADCLAHLERHVGEPRPSRRHPSVRRPKRPGLRPTRRLA